MTVLQRRKRTCRYCSQVLAGLFRFDGHFCSVTCRVRNGRGSSPFNGPVIAS